MGSVLKDITLQLKIHYPKLFISYHKCYHTFYFSNLERPFSVNHSKKILL